MDEPVPSRLRPARRHGLTSPDPVTAPHGPRGRRQYLSPAEEPDKPPNRSAAGKPRAEIPSGSSPAETGKARQRQNLRGGSRLSEIMFHGQTIVEALVALFDAVDLSAPDSSTTLSALRSSKDDISTARAATVGLGIAMKETLSENAYREVLIFESGFVIAITQDGSHADFFSTDRIDFRRFHREVASEKAALFTLKSLGSSEARSAMVRAESDPRL